MFKIKSCLCVISKHALARKSIEVKIKLAENRMLLIRPKQRDNENELLQLL